MRRSVTLVSSRSRLPGAETTTSRRSGSAVTMAQIFSICSADARGRAAEFNYFHGVPLRIQVCIIKNARIAIFSNLSQEDFVVILKSLLLNSKMPLS